MCIRDRNKRGEFPDDLMSMQVVKEVAPEDEDIGYGQVDGVIELPETKKRRKGRGRSGRKKPNSSRRDGSKAKNQGRPQAKQGSPKKSGDSNKSEGGKSGAGKRRNNKRRNNNKKSGGNAPAKKD